LQFLASCSKRYLITQPQKILHQGLLNLGKEEDHQSQRAGQNHGLCPDHHPGGQDWQLCWLHWGGPATLYSYHLSAPGSTCSLAPCTLNLLQVVHNSRRFHMTHNSCRRLVLRALAAAVPLMPAANRVCDPQSWQHATRLWVLLAPGQHTQAHQVSLAPTTPRLRSPRQGLPSAVSHGTSCSNQQMVGCCGDSRG